MLMTDRATSDIRDTIAAWRTGGQIDIIKVDVLKVRQIVDPRGSHTQLQRNRLKI